MGLAFPCNSRSVAWFGQLDVSVAFAKKDKTSKMDVNDRLETEDELTESVAAQQADLVELAKQLIALPTPHPPGDTYEPLARFIERWLTEAGMQVHVAQVPADELPQRLSTGARGPRLLVFSEAAGDASGPTLYLNGHYDTVPPGSGWGRDPYLPSVEDGRLYGLGATDMKGGLAAMMLACRVLTQAKAIQRGRLIFLASPDEEMYTQAGLVYAFDKNLIQADYAIVGESSGPNNVYVGMKGGIWGDITVYGRAAHGSQPDRGVNAFEKMASLARRAEQRLKPRLAQRSSAYHFKPSGANRPTLMLGGMVNGANGARSSVPDTCTFSFDRRLIPEETVEDAESELQGFLLAAQEADPDLKVELQVTFRAAPMAVSPDNHLCQILGEAIRQVSGAQPTFTICTGGFETSYFVDAGVQAITYGPGIEGCAHTADEYTTLDGLVAAAQVYALAAARLLG